MGPSQSRIAEQELFEKLLSERARQVQLKEVNYEDYVQVPEEDRNVHRVPNSCTHVDRSIAPQYSPRSTTVSISVAERWEKELLADPKVSRFPL